MLLEYVMFTDFTLIQTQLRCKYSLCSDSCSERNKPAYVGHTMEAVYKVNEFRCYTTGLANLNPQQGHKTRKTRPTATLLYARARARACVCVQY